MFRFTIFFICIVFASLCFPLCLHSFVWVYFDVCLFVCLSLCLFVWVRVIESAPISMQPNHGELHPTLWDTEDFLLSSCQYI